MPITTQCWSTFAGILLDFHSLILGEFNRQLPKLRQLPDESICLNNEIYTWHGVHKLIVIGWTYLSRQVPGMFRKELFLGCVCSEFNKAQWVYICWTWSGGSMEYLKKSVIFLEPVYVTYTQQSIIFLEETIMTGKIAKHKRGVNNL